MTDQYESNFATYQGKGWEARQGNLERDMEKGMIWNRCSVNSEYKTLKEVLLYIPDPAQPSVKDPNSVLHIDSINFHTLSTEMERFVNCLETNHVIVHLIQNDQLNLIDKKQYHYNLMYVCDLFFMTPQGAIISRMASAIRAGEEKYAAYTLAKIGIPILMTISGNGTFEGADAIWLRKDVVLIAVGNRTNENAFMQIKQCLGMHGIKCIMTSAPHGIQHLKGFMQIVDSHTVILRKHLVSDELMLILKKMGYHCIELSESDSILKNQALNFLMISPRHVIMVGGNPDMKKVLENNKITVVAELYMNELVKGAGGLCCATGILHRNT